jgi:hypothetical protein
MVRAVKGMIAEKAGIFLSFIMCLIGFQFITLAATWVNNFDNNTSIVPILIFDYICLRRTIIRLRCKLMRPLYPVWC